MIVGHGSISTDLIETVDENEERLREDGTAPGQAFGANSGLPILGASVGIYEGNGSAETASEDDAAPVRSGRRARAAPVLLSSDEEESEPYTPTKRQRADQEPRKRSQTMINVDQTLSDSASLPRAQLSDEQYTNGAAASESSSKARNALVISSGAEDNSSEDDVVTPVRRCRSTVASVAAASKINEFERIDSDDLDDEVADLDDTGK